VNCGNRTACPPPGVGSPYGRDMSHAQPHPRDDRGPHDHAHDEGQAQLLDLDAEVLVEHLAAIIGWLPVEVAPRRIVDLGCGTGAGTFALLDRFPGARVTAVDLSVEHLGRLREKARARGVDARVRTLEADLDDASWPDLGTPHLIWASASMHHLTHPDRALRRVHDTLAPGGLFALVEPDGLPRFLPPDAPEERPGLEERCHAAIDRSGVEHVPHPGTEWGTKLISAGFSVEGERRLSVKLDGSHDEAVGAYALATLRRLRTSVADALPAEDLAALDRLLDTDGPHNVLRRDDLAVRTERTVWAARRSS
jgi:SAM-dependent methyltransferase